MAQAETTQLNAERFMEEKRSVSGPWQERFASGLMKRRKEGPAAEDKEIKPKSSRQAAILARQREKGSKGEARETVMSPIKMGSKRLLKWAWINLVPSFGLTLIYINMHVFLRWVFPGLFCKLGDEWVPVKTGEHSPANIAGTAFGIAEVVGLILLDVLAFFIIFSIITLIIWLADNLALEAGVWVLDIIN